MAIHAPDSTVTLGQLAARGDTRLHLFCGTDVRRNIDGCRHTANMELADAVARWGADRLFDGLPVKCGRCGGRYILGGGWTPTGPGGMPQGW